MQNESSADEVRFSKTLKSKESKRNLIFQCTNVLVKSTVLISLLYISDEGGSSSRPPVYREPDEIMAAYTLMQLQHM